MFNGFQCHCDDEHFPSSAFYVFLFFRDLLMNIRILRLRRGWSMRVHEICFVEWKLLLAWCALLAFNFLPGFGLHANWLRDMKSWQIEWNFLSRFEIWFGVRQWKEEAAEINDCDYVFIQQCCACTMGTNADHHARLSRRNWNLHDRAEPRPARFGSAAYWWEKMLIR